jgi:hypothetical protein
MTKKAWTTTIQLDGQEIPVEMVGSEKQVTWAVRLRTLYQFQLEEAAKSYLEQIRDEEKRAQAAPFVKAAVIEILSNPSVKWWIDESKTSFPYNEIQHKVRELFRKTVGK